MQIALSRRTPSAHARRMASVIFRIVLALACVVLPLLLLVPLVGRVTADPAWQPLVAAVKLALILGVYAFYVNRIEKRPAYELTLQRAAREWCSGIVLGAGLFGLVIALLSTFDAFRITGSGPWLPVAGMLPGLLIGALFEEIMFRAIIFRILEESIGSWLALGISAAIFGLMHFMNPGAGVTGTLAVGIEAGILLGAAYMLTRRLWLCTAIHFAWNFTQGAIFSTAVSGHGHAGLFQSTLTGPAWLTGGKFGPEASVAAVFLCLAAGSAMLVICARSGAIVQPFWRHMPQA